jgi:hypothetical protein
MICYKFTDQATFHGLLPSNYFSEGELICYTHDYSFQELGPLITTKGEYDEDGNEITPPVIDYSHHVNYQGEPIPELEAGRIKYVENPNVTWSGVTAEGPEPEPAE